MPATRESLTRLAKVTEDGVTAAALLAMGFLPVLELILRACFNTGIPGASSYVQNLALWVGFLGAIVAARAKQHLTFIPTLAFLPPACRRMAAAFSAMVSVTACSGLAWGSIQFVRSQMDAPTRIAGWLPIWVIQAILPAQLFDARTHDLLYERLFVHTNSGVAWNSVAWRTLPRFPPNDPQAISDSSDCREMEAYCGAQGRKILSEELSRAISAMVKGVVADLGLALPSESVE